MKRNVSADTNYIKYLKIINNKRKYLKLANSDA